MSSLTKRHWLTRLLLVCGALLARGGESRAADAIRYNRDIRPILAENCFRCHGPDSASRKADLRLDRREVAIESGAIEPGKPEDSGIIERIFSTDPKMIMPPPETHKTLSDAQKDLLQRWVAAGAEYEPHWAYIAPVRPELPAVKKADWVKNPIDRFILARLEQNGLQPAAEADRRTLARRASFDLTGLPPAPADVEQFVADPAPDAYEKYVDRLLARPQWGEHRARYWLDAARYADTHGIHIDNYREIWAYRDWVIKAFNQNVPFDRFTIEQLAGDLLPNRTLAQQVGSGFNRCNITTSEGGAIDEEYLVLYARDRTETTSLTWLGLTAGCAVCHDHKFDPLTQKEFYSLAAFFNNTTQAAMDGNIKDTPPIVKVPSSDEDRQRQETLPGELAEAGRQAEARKQAARPDFDAWLAKATPDDIIAASANSGLLLQAPLSEAQGKRSTFPSRGSPIRSPPETSAGKTGTCAEGRADRLERGGRDSGLRRFRARSAAHAGRLDQADAARPDRRDRRPDGRSRRLPGLGLFRPGQSDRHAPDQHLARRRHQDHCHDRSEAERMAPRAGHVRRLGQGGWHPRLLRRRTAGDRARGQSGVEYDPHDEAGPTGPARQRRLAAQQRPITRLARLWPRAVGRRHHRLAKGQRIAALASKPAAQLSDAERDELYQGWLTAIDPAYKQLRAREAALQQEDAAIKARATIAHVMQEKPEMPKAYLLFRGEYDKRRDEVTPATPAFLPAMPDDLPRNRLGLAQWLLRPENPLTARVTANRFWLEVFGTGLVRTAGDFGTSGELPSHPELLDWLAIELRDSGWDMKKLYRLLVTSATYRQAATLTPDKLEKDSQNRLLLRGPRFRMDAEMIRDAALASSGLLVPKIGGPSVKPYQPDGVWEAVAMIGSNTRDYVRDRGESLYRRSLYTFWKRARRRPRWTSSTPQVARSARSAASGPIRRCKRW